MTFTRITRKRELDELKPPAKRVKTTPSDSYMVQVPKEILRNILSYLPKSDCQYRLVSKQFSQIIITDELIFGVEALTFIAFRSFLNLMFPLKNLIFTNYFLQILDKGKRLFTKNSDFCNWLNHGIEIVKKESNFPNTLGANRDRLNWYKMGMHKFLKGIDCELNSYLKFLPKLVNTKKIKIKKGLFEFSNSDVKKILKKLFEIRSAVNYSLDIQNYKKYDDLCLSSLVKSRKNINVFKLKNFPETHQLTSFKSLTEALKFNSLTSLTIESIKWKPEFTNAMNSSLQNKKIKKLKFLYISNGSSLLSLLGKHFKANQSIESVSLLLSTPDTGIENFVPMLNEGLKANNSLRKFYFNLVSTAKFVSVFGAIRSHKVLESLDLTGVCACKYNHGTLRDNDLSPFYRLLENNLVLKRVNLSGNKISEGAANRIAQILYYRQQSLELNLSYNYIGVRGMESLQEVAKQRDNVKINLENQTQRVVFFQDRFLRR